LRATVGIGLAGRRFRMFEAEASRIRAELVRTAVDVRPLTLRYDCGPAKSVSRVEDPSFDIREIL
jgi:hypothetical protein